MNMLSLKGYLCTEIQGRCCCSPSQEKSIRISEIIWLEIWW